MSQQCITIVQPSPPPFVPSLALPTLSFPPPPRIVHTRKGKCPPLTNPFTRSRSPASRPANASSILTSSARHRHRHRRPVPIPLRSNLRPFALRSNLPLLSLSEPRPPPPGTVVLFVVVPSWPCAVSRHSTPSAMARPRGVRLVGWGGVRWGGGVSWREVVRSYRSG